MEFGGGPRVELRAEDHHAWYPSSTKSVQGGSGPWSLRHPREMWEQELKQSWAACESPILRRSERPRKEKV